MATPIIAIDPGHGLKTSGKQTPDGIKEWTLNDKVRDKVVAILADYDCKIIHTDNNEGATDESLSSRVAKYVAAGAEAFVSIHHNAFTGKWNTATGVEVYTDKKPTAKDIELANLIYNKMVKYTGLKGRGVKKAAYTVINQNTIPAVLCEGGFMDGSKDYKIITSEAGQTAYAKAVAEGLIEFLNLKKKAAPKTYVTIQAERLSKGSTGKAVTAIQVLLANKGYSLTPDGIFGAKTDAAVRDFQKKSGTGVDGIVGVKTWTKILGTN